MGIGHGARVFHIQSFTPNPCLWNREFVCSTQPVSLSCVSSLELKRELDHGISGHSD
jgi:hypothetical protein